MEGVDLSPWCATYPAAPIRDLDRPHPLLPATSCHKRPVLCRPVPSLRLLSKVAADTTHQSGVRRDRFGEDLSSHCMLDRYLVNFGFTIPLQYMVYITATQPPSRDVEPALLGNRLLKTRQDTRFDLLQFLADFFPNTLLHFLSICCHYDSAPLRNRTTAQIATVGLGSLASCVNQRPATILGGSGEE
jgi:hypothetical protein